MPIKPSHAVWGALLGACVIHENVELGEAAAEWLFELEPENTGNHVLMAKIYASRGRWKDAENVRELMNEIGLRKTPAHIGLDDDEETVAVDHKRVRRESGLVLRKLENEERGAKLKKKAREHSAEMEPSSHSMELKESPVYALQELFKDKMALASLFWTQGGSDTEDSSDYEDGEVDNGEVLPPSKMLEADTLRQTLVIAMTLMVRSMWLGRPKTSDLRK
ncbi:hypothetical protein EZV62_028071 [Acer yangbiense]|uniref:Pentacotripeptide-repeat region of PRORP domain-containing protein n=1 Tax=Acer yangbiense TaxID=1000413 RepID=A0A5C7GP85_9ROSI|nr:hypothetical protein EZV62_028071 [Acer yangbiense]